MSQPFVHLHLHTAYSLSEGAIKVSRLPDLCRAAGTPAAAITDSNNLFGALEASETLAKAGVQPIIGIQQSFRIDGLAGMEALKAPAAPLVLLARSETGYRNLMRLSSAAFLQSRLDDGPCADLAWLADFSAGLICLTGGFDGPLDRLLRAGRSADAEALAERLQSLFPGACYVELQRHEGRCAEAAERQLVDLAYRRSLPLVATNEPYFSAREDYEAHDALLCIAEGAYVHQDDRRRVTPDHYFKSASEMAALFADLPEAFRNTVEIARRCAYRPRTREPILPRYLAGDAADEAAELERQAREGLAARISSGPLSAPEADYWARLDSELSIIGRMGFAGYFLIVADFIKWAKGEGVPVGPGRGSGAGSLVAYALTITDLDPLRFGLLFERMLNPERVSMPDFDIDFCQDRRDEVIRYVQSKYGADRVAQIITFGKLQARAVLRDVGRVLGLPYGLVDRLCKLVPNNPADPVTLAKAIETEPRLREERARDETVSALLDIALKLEGLYRHASTHAAGVVIGDRPLAELTPLYQDSRSGMPATQFNMKWVDSAGLVKFDFLGLKTLTVIEKAVALARAAGREIDASRLPLDDPKTFAMLGEGAAAGVFQLESSGMRSTLRSMRPDCLEDIIALVSLYRPGPMENIPTYIERKQGRQQPDYLHPRLEGILKETYGVIIYQEQVMQIAQVLSGYTLGEADLLRRAMGKKQKDEMDRQRRRFIEGAGARGVDATKAASIFELVEKFAGYGFNKSHAACYAYIAYQTAWLKANRPAEFFAATMSLDRSNTDKLADFVKEARSFGVEVIAPHVNHSEADFSVNDSGAVVYALSAVKNTGEAAMELIVAARRAGGPFRDLVDFAERADLKAIGKRALENLARAGAFDGLGASRAAALSAVDLLIRHSAAMRAEAGSGQRGLFELEAAPALERPRLPSVDEAPPLEKLNHERSALGFYFSGHPLDDYERELKRLNVSTIAEARDKAGGGRTASQIAAVVRSVRMRRSRAGRPFAWVECSDTSGEIELTVFSDVLAASREFFETGALLLLSISSDERDGETRFVCESARRLDAAAAQTATMLKVTLAGPEGIDGVRRRLAAVKREAADGARLLLSLRLPEPSLDVEFAIPAPAPCTPALRGALKTVEGVAEVELI
jgi:DNA polymerase-3 subunit alpha